MRMSVLHALTPINRLSTELYQKPMHFFLELLQNADDSDYSDVKDAPKVDVTVRKKTVRFDTNEVGFRCGDVEAICSIAQSTKTSKRDAAKAQRIGEKGIGFKAVFSVADRVYIQSGHYSFRFDSNATLGRLMPQWADFPQARRPGFTSILLFLRPGVDRARIVQEMKKLDGTVLMFLRNIKTVKIDLPGSSLVLQTRLGVHDSNPALSTRYLSPDRFANYIVSRYPVSGLPANEPKRQGRSKSELVLAFPMPRATTVGDRSVFPATHKAYSFLPIRDYGFSFVLQADFLLVANREEIKASSLWNVTLRQNIPSAVAAAVAELNKTSLRYHWPHFMPVRSEQQDFFKGVGPEVLALLSAKRILESAKGQLMRPSDLFFTPVALASDVAQDLASQSMIPPELSIFAYPSTKYPTEAQRGIKWLGAKPVSAAQFLQDLSHFVGQYTSKFRAMPNSWHSRLAVVLDSLVSEHKMSILSLPFIPTRDGAWAAPDCQSLMFPLNGGQDVPDKIGKLVVRRDVAANPSRKALLRKLGAQDVTREEVCRLIVQVHESNQLGFENPDAISQADLIKHAEFLYQARWSGSTPSFPLWVGLEDSRRRLRSGEVYLDLGGVPYSASHMFGRHRAKFPFLHKDYYAIFHTEHAVEWLKTRLKLSGVPRLEQPPIYKGMAPDVRSELHPDFRFLAGLWPNSPEVLLLLKTHIDVYKSTLVSQPEATTIGGPESKNSITEFFSGMQVPCRGGRSAPLGQTCLARDHILAALGIPTSEGEPGSAESRLEVLDVPEPTSEKWDFLQHLGVTVDVKIQMLLGRLQRLKTSPGTSATKEQVSFEYEMIEKFSKPEDMGIVK
jgi:hypothetical protein